MLFASLIASAGVFGYDKYTASVRERKAEELRVAEESINRDTVEGFLRLRDRFEATETLLAQHVGLSQFFDLLESVSVKNVQFTRLSVQVQSDRTATLEMGGAASTFNALAVESAAFANEKRIRRAIFSGISTNEKGVVEFSLDAELDPRLVVWTGPAEGGAAVTAPASGASMPAVNTVPTTALPAAPGAPTSAPTTPSAP